jgi:di/tricarboxylate transporter
MSSSAVVRGLLDMNHVDFDFNLPFEQLFLSIIPSALFILSTSWRIVRQVRKPNVINARRFQLIKLARQDLISESTRVWVLTFRSGCYHDLCWPRIDSACTFGYQCSPSYGCVSAISGSQTNVRIIHGCFELARPQ